MRKTVRDVFVGRGIWGYREAHVDNVGSERSWGVVVVCRSGVYV